MAGLSGEVDVRSRFTVLTPPGRGAVATIAVRGAGALATVGRRFVSSGGRPLADYEVGRAVYGRFRSAAAMEEDIVVGIVAEGEAEIHCHGGEAAARAICDALAEEGAVRLTADDWIGGTTVDLVSAAALKALASVRTERAAAVLLDQYRGALRTEIERIGQLLSEKKTKEAEIETRQLLRWADLGLHLTQPWKVVFAGRPNVGKSSLMNAILGYERSIVWPEPGTTRDVLIATTAIEGWWVEFSDVAGLRASGEVIEAAGIARAEQQIAAADLVVFVVDATGVWDGVLYRNVCAAAKRQIVVHNKSDLNGAKSDGRPLGVATSAVTGLGVKELCWTIGKTLVPESPPRGSAVPFTEQQVQSLGMALLKLERVDVDGAVESLSRFPTPAATG